jgi:hypothetical protein
MIKQPKGVGFRSGLSDGAKNKLKKIAVEDLRK